VGGNTLPVGTIRRALLGWYRRNRRDLPWRRSRDPYAIWLSEVMLQQTQVATVIPYYERFLERFPNIESLAQASEDEVLSMWSGLGYYRRARGLRDGAQAVMERHAGRLPRDPVALRALPGIGRYTAGAVASMAFDLPEPIVDGNVRRVLSRWLALAGSGLRRTSEERPLWELAQELVQGTAPGDLNQSLMELGATICTPRKPDCPACPVRRHCAAVVDGDPERYPRARPVSTPISLHVAVAWIVRGARVLLTRRQPESVLRGAWDLPAFRSAAGSDPRETLRKKLAESHGLEAPARASVCSVRHGIMNLRLTLDIHPCRLLRGRTAGNADLRWVAEAELANTPISGATRKVWRLMTGDLQSRGPTHSSRSSRSTGVSGSAGSSRSAGLSGSADSSRSGGASGSAGSSGSTSSSRSTRSSGSFR
jgi:A/G-specific adenine glycosylase